jgi:excinuclease ABC subunit C
VSREEYAEVTKQVILFLEGKEEVVVKQLQDKMNQSAEALHYEKAAILRDQIKAIHQVIEGQRIATKVKGEQDVIAFAQDRDLACVQVFFIRTGKLIGRESFVLQGTEHEETGQIMTNFVKQFYSSSPYVPPLLLLQHPVEDMAVVKGWLQSKRGRRVDIQVPHRGDKKELVNIVAENAKQGLEQLRIKKLAAPRALEAALAELQRELHLPRTPLRIEGYDISDIQGMAAVGSMVVFEQGRPKSAQYRRFRIKTVPGADDYAMLQEVLRRRFKRVKSETPTEGAWAVLPDLVLIDGGKGQLNAALSVMQELGATEIPTASLAKENEEIFLPRQAEPVRLPGNSPGRQLLQRVRDESHRFALGYHQKVRKKESFASALDTIPGIGPRRKRALLRKFGSVRAISEASLEELAATKEMSRGLAKKIKEYL